MTKKTGLVEKQDTSVLSQEPTSPMMAAIQSGASPSELLQFMELQERWEANEARKAYFAAMTAFKANPPEIFKNKLVSYNTDKGTTEYRHSSLDHVSKAISEEMAKHGLSFTWHVDRPDNGAMIQVSCVISHVLGHSERVMLSAGADQSGGKNNIQAVGSTITYLERYTLLAATGLATEDMDDDGKGSELVETITEEQALTLHAKATENGVYDDFMKWLGTQGVNNIDDIRADRYEHVNNKLDVSIKARKQKDAKD